MNNWLNKLERKYGRFGIPNLTNILVAGQILVFAIELFIDRTITAWVGLNRFFLLQGQIWRAITFVFIPFSGGSILSVVLGIYFTWFVGTALEKEWGDFRFNVYYLCGMLGAILAAALTGYGTSYYINLSLFFAFAMLYPDFQVLLFFIIPIKMKYMALFSGALCLIDLLMGGWSTRAAVLLSLANFLLFFGGDFFRTVKQEIKYHKTRRTWQNQNRSNWR